MASRTTSTSRPPNVVLVLTDDQGYGDLGCTGNPWIQTPCIDRFHGESVRFTDFHVSPLCTPTRGALMTGHNPLRNGAWATCWGRSILRRDEVTLANVFENSGYATGMFGKWHLGDNYPYRPQDRGFQSVVAHRGGGVGQTPDFWGNNYFNDTYFHNGSPVPHTGYCTDIWFDEAMRFIESNRDRPFFCYLATNAPHSPYLVEDRYKAPYGAIDDIPEPAFYGMITNIDENMGRLEARLAELGLRDDTLLIFMTDNGSSGGWRPTSGKGFNAGMRGIKGSFYDGGHRVPFMVRWPAAGIEGGRDVSDLVTHMDLVPTFIDLFGLAPPEGVGFDGLSVAPLLRGQPQTLPDRTIFVQNRQSTEIPEKWENAVITQRWRLVGGEELYDIVTDPGQENDVSDLHPEVVSRLRDAHEAWWDEISPQLNRYCPISLGNDAENPTRLDAMDVMGDVAWNQVHIATAQRSTGRWTVDVERTGKYSVSLRRWPEELGLSIGASLSREDAADLAPYGGTPIACRSIHPSRARLSLFGREETCPVECGAARTTFHLELEETGVTELEAWFDAEDGETQGAYYVYVERLE
ncbi:MAG: arylsulfatase [Candidatus Latescibacteria bacterium]|jgi:arylsulfatase A-like enzyme|nr:arylsulfatase [Candidatus Latescibacterota bacterium]